MPEELLTPAAEFAAPQTIVVVLVHKLAMGWPGSMKLLQRATNSSVKPLSPRSKLSIRSSSESMPQLG
jgi:hypothetical protein